MHEDDLYRLEDLLRMVKSAKDLADFEQKLITKTTIEEAGLAVLLHALFCRKNHASECDFYTEKQTAITTWENVVKEMKRINNLTDVQLLTLRELLGMFQMELEQAVKKGGISTLTAFYDLFEIPPHKRLHTTPPEQRKKVSSGILPETPVVS